jgi:hypothetical protein
MSQDIKIVVIIIISKEMLLCITSHNMQIQPKLMSSKKRQDKASKYRHKQPDLS